MLFNSGMVIICKLRREILIQTLCYISFLWMKLYKCFVLFFEFSVNRQGVVHSTLKVIYSNETSEKFMLLNIYVHVMLGFIVA